MNLQPPSTPETTEPLLDVQGLRIHFPGEQGLAQAVDGIDYTVGRGETVCIVGESGCGKTVSALATMGLVPTPPAVIAGGNVRFEGQELLDMSESARMRIRGRRISMVFQEPMTSLNPVFPIGEQIAEAIQVHESLADEPLHRRIVELLDSVGLRNPEQRVDDYPHQLSGGQRQRVMIAMALGCRPDLVIADEPTTALDVTVQAQILRLLQRLQKTYHMAIQYITHDLGVVRAIADRVYVMYAGIMVEEGRVQQIFKSARHPYTQALLAALPARDKRGQRLYSIPGNVPHPAFKPAGCPFHPRCPLKVSTCEKQLPQMCDWESGHRARCPVTCADKGAQR